MTGVQTCALPIYAAGTVRHSILHHFPHGSGPTSSLRVDGYKLIYNYDHIGASTTPELELYRLENDDGSRGDLEEAHNLAAELPEKAQEMKTRLFAALDAVDASRPYLNPKVKEPLPGKEKVCRALNMERDGQKISVTFEERGAKVVRGYVYYLTRDSEKYEEWFRLPAVAGDGRLSAELPADATQVRASLIDENNYLVTYPDPEEPLPARQKKSPPESDEE